MTPVRLLALLVLSLPVTACFDTSDDDDDQQTQTPTPVPVVTVTPTVSALVGEVETHDFGTRSLPAGSSPVFRFNVPSDAIGFDLLAIGGASDQNKRFIFFNVIAPGDRVVIDNALAGVRQYPKDGASSLFFPADDSTASQVESGAWTFQVAAATTDLVASNPQVLVKVRRRAGGVPNGRIDINMFIVEGNHGYTATTASQPGTDINLALNHMQALWNTIGVEVYNVTWWDLTWDSPDSLNSLETEAELGTLLAFSDDIIQFGGIPNRIHMFLIDDFAGDYGTGVAGIAGGIPAPMDFPGTKHSGVVVAYNAVSTVEEMGEVMAHEAAHSVGLYHTTEFTGTDYDPISDTPQCNASTMGSDPSSCPDFANSMFPSVTGFSQGFSSGQGVVLRPSVIAYTNPVGFTSSSASTGGIDTVLPKAGPLVKREYFGPAPTLRCGVQ